MNRVSRLGLLVAAFGLAVGGPGCRLMDPDYDDDERCSEYRRIEPELERQRGVPESREPGIYPSDAKR